MELSDLDLNKLYTYADYLKWKFEELVELIKGRIFEMIAPNTAHQRLTLRISLEIGNYLKGKECEIFAAPFDVRFPRKSKEDNDLITVFQPDLCVVCDPSKIDFKGFLGVPDLIIEILSPANNKKELKYKYEVYEEAGVLEYWIVDPREKAVQVYLLTNGKLIAGGYLFEEDKILSALLPGFSLDVGELFKNV
jgi:Uma2 family endonuclease